MKKSVAVGMSGGVDSSLTAALLVERGYQVTGVFLECWRAPGCRTDEDRKDALGVALKLKIPFKVLDFKKEYKKSVVDYFFNEYKAGRTPNPDVMCNKEIKFGMFYDWALKNGFDYVATGHYARIDEGKLLRGVDEKKDQSYFLYQLKAVQLKHILFPLGEMTKKQVRLQALRRGLKVANKPDSQGICFIGEIGVVKFLKDLGMKEKKGEVVDSKGEVIGEHIGAWFYTIGQRHGFTTDLQKGEVKTPTYVIEKEVKKNRLVVGFGAETYQSQFYVSDINWLMPNDKLQITNKQRTLVRIRHGGELLNAKLQITNDKLTVSLDEPQRGIAPGQAAVFYSGEGVVLGGGTISD